MIPIWLLSPKLWAGAGAALVLGFAGVQTLRLNHAKADLKAAREALYVPASKPRMTWQKAAQQAQRDLTTCRGNVSTLEGAIGRQNAAVETMRADAERRAAAAQAAVLDARRNARAAADRASAILARKPGPDACQSADALILESLR